jgi:cell division protein ZapA
MANIDVDVAGRRYDVACRDGEEEHLRALAAVVDRRAQDAQAALGGLTETRQLLFAALLIADDLKETRAGMGLPDLAPPPTDPTVAEALERLAHKLENLADRLEEVPEDA